MKTPRIFVRFGGLHQNRSGSQYQELKMMKPWQDPPWLEAELEKYQNKK